MDSVALQQVCEAVPAPMLVVDQGARIVAANAPAGTLLGGELADRPFVTVLRHPGVNQAALYTVSRLVTYLFVHRFFVRLRRTRRRAHLLNAPPS